jgi:cobalt-zinc-cadmium efflux system outer membrane protein
LQISVPNHWIAGAVMVAAQLGGCGSGLSGTEILEDLRRRDALLPEEGEPLFSRLTAPQETDPLDRDEITIENLLAAADRFSPQIGRARAAIGVAAGDTLQAGLYPNPSLELESEDIKPRAGGFARSETTVGIVQPIILSGRRSAAVASGSAKQRARGWDLEQTRRAVFGAVRRQVAEILYLRESIRLSRSLLDVARQTLFIAETRFEARAAPESEVIRARVEADTRELAISRFQRDLAAAGERLNMLVGGRAVPIERIAVELASTAPALELERLEQRVEASHPAVLAAGERIKAAEHRLDEARAGQHPDIAARVAYGFNGEVDEHLFEAGVSIPLTILDRNQGNILRARYAVVASKEQAKAELNSLRAELATAYQRYMSAREQAEAFRTRIVAAAERSLLQTREGYTAGKLAFLDLLDAQRTLAQARVAQLDLLRELNTAQADLYAILGESLEDESQGDEAP